jgi:hypothetical protein
VPQEQTTGGATRALGGIASAALRPATGALALGLRAAEDTALWTAEQLLESRIANELVDLVLESGQLERIADQVVDSPATERVLARVMDSRLVDAAVARLLESDELWLMVDQIASSPAVTEAIGRQSIGFADQVAGEVRVRSGRADERVERIARRLLRRRQRLEAETP